MKKRYYAFAVIAATLISAPVSADTSYNKTLSSLAAGQNLFITLPDLVSGGYNLSFGWSALGQIVTGRIAPQDLAFVLTDTSNNNSVVVAQDHVNYDRTTIPGGTYTSDSLHPIQLVSGDSYVLTLTTSSLLTANNVVFNLTSANPSPPPFGVPGPIAGAGLPALLLAAASILMLRQRSRSA